jgi:hypothetical protein
MATHAAKIAIDPALTMRMARLFCSASGLRPLGFYPQSVGKNPEKPPFKVAFLGTIRPFRNSRNRDSRLPGNF